MMNTTGPAYTRPATHHALYLSNHHSLEPDIRIPAPEASRYKIKLYEELQEMDKYKDSYMKYVRSPTKYHVKKKVKPKYSQIDCSNRFLVSKDTFNAPGSGRHPESTPSVSLDPDQSPNVARELLRMYKYKRKELRYEKKTFSDADTSQDEDLAMFEGLVPREGITGHHALPVQVGP